MRTFQILIARALVRLAILAAPAGAADRLRDAADGALRAAGGGGGPTKPVVPK